MPNRTFLLDEIAARKVLLSILRRTQRRWKREGVLRDIRDITVKPAKKLTEPEKRTQPAGHSLKGQLKRA